jgi:hypothetical protein
MAGGGRRTVGRDDRAATSGRAKPTIAFVAKQSRDRPPSGRLFPMQWWTLRRRRGDDRPRTITGPAQPQRGAPTPSTVTGGLGFVADLDTLCVVKHRQAGERRVLYVTFAAEHPRLGLLEMKYAYRVEPAPDGGWRTFGGAGGAGTLSGRATQTGVNLGGGGWPRPLLRWRGDLPRRRGYRTGRAALRQGVTLSDDAYADVALFITDSSAQLPATAVLLDPAANEIRSETAFR